MPPRSGGGSGCIPGPREGASAPPNARGHGDVKTPLSSWGFSSFEVDLSISTGCCPGHSLHLRFKASHRSLPSSSVWQRCSQRDEMMHSSCRAAASASEEDHIRFFREERGGSLFTHLCVLLSFHTMPTARGRASWDHMAHAQRTQPRTDGTRGDTVRHTHGGGGSQRLAARAREREFGSLTCIPPPYSCSRALRKQRSGPHAPFLSVSPAAARPDAPFLSM